MALDAKRAPPSYNASVGTTCTVLTPGNGVHTIEICADGDLYVMFDDTLSDGSAVPAGTHRIPLNTFYYAPVAGPKVLIAAVSGTAKVSILGIGF